MNNVDIKKIRRESIRWHIMQTLDVARPVGANEDMLISVLVEVQANVTRVELRRELDYLKDLKIITVKQCERINQLRSSLTAHGIDIAEYVEPCPKGIARPAKYWQ